MGKYIDDFLLLQKVHQRKFSLGTGTKYLKIIKAKWWNFCEKDKLKLQPKILISLQINYKQLQQIYKLHAKLIPNVFNWKISNDSKQQATTNLWNTIVKVIHAMLYITTMHVFIMIIIMQGRLQS